MSEVCAHAVNSEVCAYAVNSADVEMQLLDYNRRPEISKYPGRDRLV